MTEAPEYHYDVKPSEPTPCPFGKCQSHTPYRYRWPYCLDGQGSSLLFVMKNPSCPDDTTNQTFRNMVKYAKKLNASSLDVVNLFARRTGKSPKELNDMPSVEAIGPENDRHIVEAASKADLVIAAWGDASGVKEYKTRIADVDHLLRDHDLWRVGRVGRDTAQPMHPQVWSPTYDLRLWRRAVS